MVLSPLVTEAECGEETVLIDGTLVEGAGSSRVITSPVFAHNNRGIQNRENEPPVEKTGETQSASQPVEKSDVEEKKTEDIGSKLDPFERDFDKNPTVLYALIQKKAWNEAIVRAQGAPEESRIWVSRTEKDGSLRWRLLPIHAAIVFKAPEKVIETLLAAYPQGAQAKDDQGMLPLHLAFRTGSSEGVVNLLLVACPQSIDVKDRKGRIPLVLAQASNSPNREAFMRALERGPTYYAVAAAATERASVTAEQRAIFDAKQMQHRQSHQHELATVKSAAEKNQRELQDKLDTTEKELLKAQETSQVLVDHVNSLEAQLNSRSDTERFLATKIATLDSSLKDTCKTKGEIEGKLKTENFRLIFERDNLKTQVADLRAKYEISQEKLTQSLDLFERREKEWTRTEEELSHQVKSIQIDWANAQANCAILDAQLKKKMETEHALATQVSCLAGKLAESAGDSRENSTKYAKRVRNLEDERIMLRETVRDLTKRLSLVARVLEEMTQQQNKIVEEAKSHEGLIENALSAHAKIVADAMNQEMRQELAREERRKMKEMLENQEVLVTESEQKRASIMNAIAVQGQHMENTKFARDDMLASVELMGAEIKDVMNTVLTLLPTVEKDEDLVDAVLKNLNSPPPSEEKKEESPEPEESKPKKTLETVVALAHPPSVDEKDSLDEGTVSTENISKGTAAELDEQHDAGTVRIDPSDRIMVARESMEIN